MGNCYSKTIYIDDIELGHFKPLEMMNIITRKIKVNKKEQTIKEIFITEYRKINYCSKIFKTCINIFNSSLLSLEPPINLLTYEAVFVIALATVGMNPFIFFTTVSIGWYTNLLISLLYNPFASKLSLQKH